ncbi:MAG: TRAP transporter small permease [Bacillota bacterium]|jgi:TRAP-type C4-dicarboxylate transport system permease small subunit
MKEFNEKVGGIETWISVGMLAAIIVLVFASAVMRTFRYPIIWSVDLAQLLFVWICMLGADAALKKRAHVGVDLLAKQFPVRIQNIITLTTYIISVLFLVFITYHGLSLCVKNYLRQYATLQISYSFGTVAVPIGSILMILTFAEQIINLFGNWDKPSIG